MQSYKYVMIGGRRKPWDGKISFIPILAKLVAKVKKCVPQIATLQVFAQVSIFGYITSNTNCLQQGAVTHVARLL